MIAAETPDSPMMPLFDKAAQARRMSTSIGRAPVTR
jgi:hypothetical protein